MNGPLDFSRSTDHRIEFTFASQLGEVATEAVQRRSLALAALARRTAAAAFLAATSAALTDFGSFESVAEQVENFFANVFELQPEIHQDLSRHALLLAEQPEQDVFRPDVAVIEVSSLFHRVLDDLLRARRLWQFADSHHFGTTLDQFLDFQTNLSKVNVQVFENVGSDSAAFFDKTEQDVLGADVFVVESLRFLVGQLHDLPSAIGKSFVHGIVSLPGGWSVREFGERLANCDCSVQTGKGKRAEVFRFPTPPGEFAAVSSK